MLAAAFNAQVLAVGIAIAVLVGVGLLALLVKCYHKVSQGEALIRNGVGGTKVSFSGKIVIPILHRPEYMDISVKRIEIDRGGASGLICQDNLRADIKVAFFVRVNNTVEDVMKVAQAIGCKRASDEHALYELFDAKFSEALKTVGKRFDFADLYTERVKFKEEILQVIGTDLNGFVLEDAAIDYLEQTEKKLLNPDNILDAEGIKKITMLTASQFELANNREREKDKTIRRQDVEAQETILELNRQLAEAEAKQKREVEAVQAREGAEALKVIAVEREKAEKARIAADEEIAVAEQNKDRTVIVAAKNKERTEAVEIERVTRDRNLEIVERERLVQLAAIARDKSVESQKKELQDTIRERVVVEKTVVAEEERIKDTREFATADRAKKVQITHAEKEAEAALVKDIKAAEAQKRAAEELAQKQLIEADANLKAADKNAVATKTLADAAIKEHAVEGTAEAQVLEAKAVATEKQGAAEARVLEMKYLADAKGITEKAEAMKLFDAVGKGHEEFKLRLNKDRDIELAGINVQKDIAEQQARIVAEALKASNIEIIGGENRFFERLVGSITNGKAVDRIVDNSRVLGEFQRSLLSGDGDACTQIRQFVGQFGLTSNDMKNLTISALVLKLIGMADGEKKGVLQGLLKTVEDMGIGHKNAHEVIESLDVTTSPVRRN